MLGEHGSKYLSTGDQGNGFDVYLETNVQLDNYFNDLKLKINL